MRCRVAHPLHLLHVIVSAGRTWRLSSLVIYADVFSCKVAIAHRPLGDLISHSSSSNCKQSSSMESKYSPASQVHDPSYVMTPLPRSIAFDSRLTRIPAGHNTIALFSMHSALTLVSYFPFWLVCQLEPAPPCSGCLLLNHTRSIALCDYLRCMCFCTIPLLSRIGVF